MSLIACTKFLFGIVLDERIVPSKAARRRLPSYVRAWIEAAHGRSRILVTGATAVIGSAIRPVLAARYPDLRLLGRARW
jgi:hypothetical protein